VETDWLHFRCGRIGFFRTFRWLKDFQRGCAEKGRGGCPKKGPTTTPKSKSKSRKVVIMTINITVDGNVGIVNELRETKDGTPVLNFTVAHNHRAQNAQGVWETKNTSWFNVAVFGTGASSLKSNPSFRKGCAVILSGTLELTKYTNPTTNVPTQSANVTALNVGLNARWGDAQPKLVEGDPGF
jgi:single stranded DNA-binding protein